MLLNRVFNPDKCKTEINTYFAMMVDEQATIYVYRDGTLQGYAHQNPKNLSYNGLNFNDDIYPLLNMFGSCKAIEFTQNFKNITFEFPEKINKVYPETLSWNP